jgi:hypothetical protein
MFSIPSPIQTAYLLKRLNIPFNSTLLNNETNVNDYVTEYQQALNLGVYGADLGYAALYEEKGTVLKYLGSIQKLTSKLKLDGAFDTSFFKRVEKNGNSGDSMIFLMTDAFKDADFFLKEANRKPVTALILTGGWIESLYFACELNKQKINPNLIRRIAEQKQSLESLIEILDEYNNEGGQNNDLIEMFTDLKTSFDKITTGYTYVAPEIDEKAKLTTLSHGMNVEMSDALLAEISKKITVLRSNITNVK